MIVIVDWRELLWEFGLMDCTWGMVADEAIRVDQLGYGLGTARAKGRGGSDLDQALVKTVVMAIKGGYHHLDGAEGK